MSIQFQFQFNFQHVEMVLKMCGKDVLLN